LCVFVAPLQIQVTGKQKTTSSKQKTLALLVEKAVKDYPKKQN
jgi:hypothetical protein